MSSAGGENRLRALIVTGPPGTGKTTTMWAIHEVLSERKVPNAVIDVDYVRNAWPAAEGDRFNSRLGRRNVRAMAETYRDHGCRWLLLADVIENAGDVASYASVLPDWEIAVVRLEVERMALVARLEKREAEDSLQWYLDRSAELQGIMEHEGVGDVLVQVGPNTPREIAELILERLG